MTHSDEPRPLTPAKSPFSPDVQRQADLCIQAVLAGAAQADASALPPAVYAPGGCCSFTPGQLLERYLTGADPLDFPCSEAMDLCSALRQLTAWRELAFPLDKFVEQQILRRYAQPDQPVSEPLLRFGCYVAVCHMVYGSGGPLPQCSVFQLAAALCPGLAQQLKEQGTGQLPSDLQRCKTPRLTACANDAMASIRLLVKEDSPAAYAEALDYLCRVVQQPCFPHSYAIEYRGPARDYLPGLPKKGVNQLFACAARYPALHPAIQTYARLAARPKAQYTNLPQAVPGAFAVFALALASPQYWSLACDHLALCGPAQAHLVEKFLHTLIAQTGFVPEVLPVLVRGVQAAGRLRPGPTFAKLAASTASLDALLALKADLPAYLPAGDRRSTAARAALWESICFAIWGPPGCKGGIKVIRAAPQALKPRYTVLFGP